MKIFLVTLSLGLFTLPSFSEDARYETVTISLNQQGVVATNQIEIADYETGQVAGFGETPGLRGYIKYSFRKNGLTFPTGGPVRGPAVFYLTATSPGDQVGGYITVKITPVSFPPDKTLIVPPGTNQVQISLESSTNLVSWASATNGIYGSPDSAHFFRLKMTPLN
jgi:hypothetical protein